MGLSEPIRPLLLRKPVFFPGSAPRRKHKCPNLVEQLGLHWLLSNPVVEAAGFSVYTRHVEASGGASSTLRMVWSQKILSFSRGSSQRSWESLGRPRPLWTSLPSALNGDKILRTTRYGRVGCSLHKVFQLRAV